jgi:hypothetical protein
MAVNTSGLVQANLQPSWIADLPNPADREHAAAVEADMARMRAEMGVLNSPRQAAAMRGMLNSPAMQHAQAPNRIGERRLVVASVVPPPKPSGWDLLCRLYHAQQRHAFARRTRLKLALRGFVLNHLCW